ncbi:lipopolysaccharide-induced tumor necrosis factor-alpha factor homolog [Dysidea avara]|uniref:lipopolysaccharide-induced tumor necrosis factor-alpha factor homolog n=1 Tax=Dysidea avara TaxID=196820 RepID=UPI00331EB4AF
MTASAPPPYDARDYPPPPSYGTYQQDYNPAPPQMARNHTTTNVVLINQPQARTVHMVYTRFGESSTPFRCRYCHTQQVSDVSHEMSSMGWLLCLILCVLGLWPFCLIPFCIDGFQNVIHTCPNCHNQVGVYRRS